MTIQVPLEWNSDRLKDVVPVITGGGTPESNVPEYWDGGDIVWVTPTDFSATPGVEIAASARTITRAGLESCAAQMLAPGTVVMSSRASIGDAKIAATELCTNQGFISFRCDERRLHNRYLRYQIECRLGPYFADIAPGTTFKEISRGVARRETVLLPRIDEQRRISDFLDQSCMAVDEAIAGKRNQVAVLKSVLDSTIARATTCGFRGDVPTKPSGLDWLASVPAHWKVQQIKRRCHLMRGKFSHRPRNDPALYDGKYPFVQTGDITAADKYIRNYSQTLNELGFGVSKMFPKGTLVMSIAANVGDVAILDFEACFPDSMVGLVPDHNTDLDFLFYLMRAMKSVLLRSAVLTTQLNLNYVRIGTNFAPFPPREEQEAIARYLDEKTADVRSIIDILAQQINTLAAYRASLIHEYVTGQRRVPAERAEKVAAYG